MAELKEVDPELVLSLKEKLVAPETDITERYRVLFSLRNVKGDVAREALVESLNNPSALFRHDVCFCLGQRQEPEAIAILAATLKDSNEHPMVRHEAGEALGAIGTPECLPPLMQYADDPVLEVAETCQLALQKMQYLEEHPDANNEESPYYSVDPTPALPASTPVSELKDMLLNEEQRMFDRYSALFALRNKGGKEAVNVLTEVFKARSALIKHEVAYVLGQMMDKHGTENLLKVLRDPKEHAMVRHEAAESLGAFANTATEEVLKEFTQDADPIVAHSCVVALDVLEHEKKGIPYFAGVTNEQVMVQ